MIHTYEFRLVFMLAGAMFLMAFSHGELLTGVWFAAGIFGGNYLIQRIFGASYAVDLVPLVRRSDQGPLDFAEQYFTWKNLYTHPLTILSMLVAVCFSGYIWGQVISSWWSAFGYCWLALFLFAAGPANLWGVILYGWIEMQTDPMNQLSSSIDGYEGQ